VIRAPDSLISQGALLRLADLALKAPPGHFAEVGVYKGGSAWYLADAARQDGRRVLLFDTFAGIPFEAPGDSNHTGEFGDTSAEAVQAAIPDAELFVGVFPDTLPVGLDGIAFVHSDCDQYQSVRAVIDHLWPRMVSGGIMAFDDMNTNGGRRAIEETFPERHQFHGWQYVVKV
jgi:predicted O-methyltransferase YrrM